MNIFAVSCDAFQDLASSVDDIILMRNKIKFLVQKDSQVFDKGFHKNNFVVNLVL